jgi:hypothetical protein
MTDEPTAAVERPDPLRDTRLDEATAARLTRVLRALAEAGMIDEYQVFAGGSRV